MNNVYNMNGSQTFRASSKTSKRSSNLQNIDLDRIKHWMDKNEHRSKNIAQANT